MKRLLHIGFIACLWIFVLAWFAQVFINLLA